MFSSKPKLHLNLSSHKQATITSTFTESQSGSLPGLNTCGSVQNPYAVHRVWRRVFFSQQVVTKTKWRFYSQVVKHISKTSLQNWPGDFTHQ